ncbi:hypothetical protein Pve01_20320 [Planomonospora venezuelensis]|nr:hypothetical protein Pve01_20320 [Planomonospora venezuelensis]
MTVGERREGLGTTDDPRDRRSPPVPLSGPRPGARITGRVTCRGASDSDVKRQRRLQHVDSQADSSWLKGGAPPLRSAKEQGTEWPERWP